MQSKNEKLLFDAAVADAASTPMNIMDFDVVNFTVVGVGGTTTGTIQFLVSDQEECPNFDAAASITNRYTVESYKDLYTGGAVSGATPASIATAGVTKYQLNNTGSGKWVALDLDWTAGAFTAYGSGYDSAK